MSPLGDSAGKAGCEGPVPTVISSRTIYTGRVISVRVDELAVEGGNTVTREVVDHPGAVVILALDDLDHLYMVRQYRHAVGRSLLELPAGTLEPGEEPLAAAKRELREEVGVEAGEWKGLGSFFSSPGFIHERLHVFVARGLIEVGSDPDEDEELTLLRVGLSELRDLSVDIQDAKSLAALYLLEREPEHGRRT